MKPDSGAYLAIERTRQDAFSSHPQGMALLAQSLRRRARPGGNGPGLRASPRAASSSMPCRGSRWLRVQTLIAPLLGLAMAASSAPAFADAGNFTLVNRTGANISTLQIRRVGTAAWQPLTGSPASGARIAVAFANPDCAFDIQAQLADGKAVTFTGVNLCDATVVTLNRGQNGQVWVDYD